MKKANLYVMGNQKMVYCEKRSNDLSKIEEDNFGSEVVVINLYFFKSGKK